MRSLFSLIWSWCRGLYETIIRKLGGSTTQPDDPDISDRPVNPGEVICYYGCPNSKKAQKLQLDKKLYR